MLSISSEDYIRKQYRIAIINAILNGDSRNAAYVLEFVRHNLEKIIDLYVDFTNTLRRLLSTAVDYFAISLILTPFSVFCLGEGTSF